MNYTYETVGNSSYLVATFVGGQGLVNYELQMLTNNEIRNILVANKHQRNDDIMIQYNITSKIALGQIDARNKIPRNGLINIIEGALIAIDEVEEYQLASSGIVFDEQYIFVNPSTYEPNFVYLPCYTDDNALERLKTFLSALIMGNKIEMSNDNFIPVMIEMLNSPDLNTKALKELCNQFKSGTANTPPVVKKEEPAPIPKAEPVIEKAPVSTPAAPSEPVIQKTPEPVKRAEIPNNNIPKKKPEIIQPNKKTEPAVTKNVKEKKEKNPKMSIFILLQVAILVILAGIFVSGAITNAKYMLAVIVIAAAVDFIVYREMFINNKKDGEKVEKSASKEVKKTPASMPQKKVITPNSGVKTPPVKNTPNPKPQPEVRQEPVNQYKPEPVAAPVAAPSVNPVPEAVQAPVAAPAVNAASQDFDLDTEVIDNEMECAYLEIYENGIASRIKLDKPVVIVGKLSSQCDFAINSNKISKIHAEFIVRDNEYFVKDCNSTNGTYLNGNTQRITSNVEYQIFDGYRITLANIDLTFRC